MTLSVALQKIYASAPVNVTWYDALWLNHSQWPEPLAFITNSIEARVFNLNGIPYSFQPAEFVIQLPKRDDLGLVDFQVQFPVTSRVINMVDLAEPGAETIQAVITTYIDGSMEPQMEPIELQLDSVVLGTTQGAGRAQRIDLLNRAYPRSIVRPLFYPGLWR